MTPQDVGGSAAVGSLARELLEVGMMTSGIFQPLETPFPRENIIGTSTKIWLVVTGCHEFFIFPEILGISFIIPMDELIFFRGVAKNHQAEILFFEDQKIQGLRHHQRSSNESWSF